MRRRRKRMARADSTAELLHTCAWCGRRIREDEEVFGLGAKVYSEVDLSESKGTIVPFSLHAIQKIVPAMVTTDDSPAKEAGNDLYFMVCSGECAGALQRGFEKEIGVVEGTSMIEGDDEGYERP